MEWNYSPPAHIFSLNERKFCCEGKARQGKDASWRKCSARLTNLHCVNCFRCCSAYCQLTWEDVPSPEICQDKTNTRSSSKINIWIVAVRLLGQHFPCHCNAEWKMFFGSVDSFSSTPSKDDGHNNQLCHSHLIQDKCRRWRHKTQALSSKLMNFVSNNYLNSCAFYWPAFVSFPFHFIVVFHCSLFRLFPLSGIPSHFTYSFEFGIWISASKLEMNGIVNCRRSVNICINFCSQACDMTHF